MTDVRAHLRAHFAAGEPAVASNTFVGVESIDVLRFGPDPECVSHYVSVGGSRQRHVGRGGDQPSDRRPPARVSALRRRSGRCAVPVTATEAAWVRLKGVDAMRKAWQEDGVDVMDPNRPAAQQL